MSDMALNTNHLVPTTCTFAGSEENTDAHTSNIGIFIREIMF